MAETRWARSPGVVETALPDELILLDPRTQEMFSLNPSGTVLWRALPATTREAAGRLREAYALDEGEAARDAEALLSALAEAGLVAAADDDAAGS